MSVRVYLFFFLFFDRSCDFFFFFWFADLSIDSNFFFSNFSKKVSENNSDFLLKKNSTRIIKNLMNAISAKSTRGRHFTCIFFFQRYLVMMRHHDTRCGFDRLIMTVRSVRKISTFQIWRSLTSFSFVTRLQSPSLRLI